MNIGGAGAKENSDSEQTVKFNLFVEEDPVYYEHTLSGVLGGQLVSPYDRLYIYEIDGRVAEGETDFPPDYIGT
jgi:hypothetical protein